MSTSVRQDGYTRQILRPIAFYLPQFHPIPENDEWWGPGFTEWTNVAQGRSLFPGHYQPHVPADLGFYDLRLAETRAAQAALAKRYGIHGFAYWHYWFNGDRLLQRPFDEVLRSGKPDFPFMLCWANENWTRTWDGGPHLPLKTQTYSEADDREHIRSLIPAFSDPRYIRVDGRPVFGVYRTELLPDPARTAEVWREEAAAAGLADLYLVRVESHKTEPLDPHAIGFDAAQEFQPTTEFHGQPFRASLAQRAFNRVFRPESPLRHHFIRDYEELVRAATAQPARPYLRYRCVCPGWDNSPRRKRWALIFRDSTPQLYGEWLSAAVRQFRPPSPEENLLFINAWNEWAEGNHLEPDLKWGTAYLEQTQVALAGAIA